MSTAIEYEKNLRIAQEKKNSPRSKFLAELSNNGAYQNLQPNIVPNSKKDNTKELSNEDIERD